MARHSLPPQIEDIRNGRVTWKRLESVDYELIGRFLSSHLIVEHYLDEMLRVLHPDLDWGSSRQTFGQKIALLSGISMPAKYDSLAAIKHLNALRNKISHNIHFRIQASDLLPLTKYLDRVFDGKHPTPTEARAILKDFTDMACVFFAGYISSQAEQTKFTKHK